MKKILISVSIIAAVAAIVIGATTAFFSDTETSTGNTFTAGAIDLTVDNTQHYNGAVCTLITPAIEQLPAVYQWVGGSGYPVPGTACDGTWLPADLGTQKFFNFSDVKPGDSGEDTISLHVSNNDAWLRLVLGNIVDNEGNPTCTEPELAVDSGCATDVNGDLRSQMLFSVWFDGIQGVTEGACDNEQNYAEPTIISEGPIDLAGETWNLKDYQGLYLNGGQTACFGINWSLPSTVGNNAQTDAFGFDATFQVEQVRNNPVPFTL